MTSFKLPIFSLLALVGSGACSTSVSSSAGHAPTGLSYPSGFDITKSWGNLSPYADAPGFGVSKGYPQGCELSQAHVLHRHTQRYPTESELDSGLLLAFASALQNASKKHPNTTIGTGPLSFLNEWNYLLGLETLLPSGAATEAEAGADFWSRYGRLLYQAPTGDANWNASLNVFANGTSRPKLTFRTTSYPRILESARWWLAGFFANTGGNSSYSEYDLVIIPEKAGFNNTLSPEETCEPKEASAALTEALVVVAKMMKNAVKRLSAFLPNDFSLSVSEVLGMLNLCPYEYAALGRSPFCSLFTEQEWRDFEYLLDLDFYDAYGFGSYNGRAQGIGYIQELAARLQHKLITSSESSINSTYDDNESDFPLGQPFYMDMSHDNVIVSVLTALGLDYFKYGPQGLPLNVTHAPRRHFKMSNIAPFGGRLVSEIWTCPKSTSFHHLQSQLYKNPDLSSSSDTVDYIRFVLNNAPLPLNGLSACDGAVNGFCPVKKFLDQVPRLTKEATYQKACFGSYNTSVSVGNGQPPQY
ncbi:hypothetical protein PMG11_10717 [Penicillium brasilianum]|uniref:Phytase n=1 Tax=Penicillium brasilianum TaxID=104259 RepID=A0A0F7U3E8_PENBI|nr:hypothetical protein PMG11_10717 [Penicillium brasilianum]